jgi:mono/diheme cytochrome c family protein
MNLKTGHSMKGIVCVFAIVTMFVLVGSALAASGSATYKAKCAMCHGADGTGKTPVGQSMGIKDFASSDIQAKSDATLKDIVTNGFKAMPAFKSQLSKAQISALVKYLRTFKK